MTLPVSSQNNCDARPIVNNMAYSDMRLFFDTGAGVPVWVAGYYYLMKFFPNASDTGCLFHLGGFGGSGSDVPVYKLPKFIIKGAEGNFVEFYCLHIVIADRNDPFNMIVSYNMFEHMQLTFDQRGPECVCIDNPKQIYIAKPSFYSLGDRTYLTGQAVYAQDSFADKTTHFA